MKRRNRIVKLLLKEDVSNLGFCGDEVEVKDGYGRNFLVPQGKALVATPENVKAFRHQKGLVKAKQRKLKHAAQEIADRISGITLEFVRKVGDQGKLFGSVTSQDIAQALEANGLDVDRRKIQISEPVKSLGEFKVFYKLHKEVTANISVKILAQETKNSEKSSLEKSSEVKDE